LRQPVGKGHQRMGIDRKPLIGCLHKIAAPAPHPLRRELALPFNPPTCSIAELLKTTSKAASGKSVWHPSPTSKWPNPLCCRGRTHPESSL
jgi:hypothetical protein